MRTITLRKNGYTFRWRGGSFIAAWEDANAKSYVPDDMIPLPRSVNRSAATHANLMDTINTHMGWTGGEPFTGRDANNLPVGAVVVGDQHEPPSYPASSLEWPDDAVLD